MADGDRPVVEALLRSGGLAWMIASLVAEELADIRGAPTPAQERRRWTGPTRLDEDGVGADSLARLRLAARLNKAFNLHESGVEDYLLVAPTLGEWTELAAEGLRRGSGRLTFETSGSTGRPKPVTHLLADLAAEAAGHSELLGPHDRVAALAPPHHIYGFLFAVLGPALRDRPTLDLTGAAPGAAARALAGGDIVVATPFLWEILLRSGAPLPAALGVTSTAPAPAQLWPDLASAGLRGLIEVHGSTETAGLGWRAAPQVPFAPLPHVERRGDRLFSRRSGEELPAPDRFAWESGGYRPVGRRDGGVQVGGVNVQPERVRAFLLAQPGVRDCAVRLDGAGAQARLKAFVIVDEGQQAEPRLRAALDRGLSPPERPQKLAFGPALPRNAIGKLSDWDA